jgi:signal transduction histidine kinase
VIGFTVNREWVREHYFKEIATAVLRVRGETQTGSIAIFDERGVVVVAAGSSGRRGITVRREFPPMFFDPGIVAPSAEHARQPWTASIVVGEDPAILAEPLGASVTYVILATTALASLFGMFFMVQIVRARSELAETHSEFVSTVTHELKTPLASIRLMGETLRHDRAKSIETIQTYAHLLSQEAWRLTRLIDNLLAYASASQARHLDFASHEVAELIEDVMTHFQQQLTSQQFVVSVDIPSDLPRLTGDRTMLIQAIENVIDNAIKYSSDRRELDIRSWIEGGTLNLEIADAGLGIPNEDIAKVHDKFFRGRNATVGGSGLGLAIVKRVMTEHGGTVRISSRLAVGTRVCLTFPLGMTHA